MRGMPLLHDMVEGTRTQPARAWLAFASLSIGMAALVTLLAILGGVRQKTRHMVGELGVNVFGLVQACDTLPREGAALLSRRHVDALAANFPGAVITGFRLDDAASAGLPDGAILGAGDENLFRVRPWRILQGRPFDAADVATRHRCAVASTALAREMNLAVGSDVRLRGLAVRVIGIADIEGGALDAAAPDRAIAPGNRLLLVPWSVPAFWSLAATPESTRVDSIFTRGNDATHLGTLIRRTGNLLQQPDMAVKGLSWVTPRSLVQRLASYQRMIMLAGGAIVLLCLVLGGLTLSSLLLSGVQTRVPEIGLRRALGASPADIGLLFMCEAVFITLSATLAGTVVAVLVLHGIRAWSPVPFHLGFPEWIVPLLSGLVLGIVFSYWPSRAAARISPAEALRNE